MAKLNIFDVNVAHHRNGTCGQSFTVCVFKWRDEDDRVRNMVANLTSVHGECFVLDVDETQRGNITRAGTNCWRGDNFEDQLREHIAAHDKRSEMEFHAMLKRHSDRPRAQ